MKTNTIPLGFFKRMTASLHITCKNDLRALFTRLEVFFTNCDLTTEILEINGDSTFLERWRDNRLVEVSGSKAVFKVGGNCSVILQAMGDGENQWDTVLMTWDIAPMLSHRTKMGAEIRAILMSCVASEDLIELDCLAHIGPPLSMFFPGTEHGRFSILTEDGLMTTYEWSKVLPLTVRLHLAMLALSLKPKGRASDDEMMNMVEIAMKRHAGMEALILHAGGNYMLCVTKECLKTHSGKELAGEPITTLWGYPFFSFLGDDRRITFTSSNDGEKPSVNNPWMKRYRYGTVHRSPAAQLKELGISYASVVLFEE